MNIPERPDRMTAITLDDQELEAAYDVVRRGVPAVRRGRHDPTRWPEWIKLLIAIISMVVSITLAWAALDKRIALVEQELHLKLNAVDQKLDVKLDAIGQQLHRLGRRAPMTDYRPLITNHGDALRPRRGSARGAGAR